MTIVKLNADKSIVKGGQEVTFLVEYNGDYDKTVALQLQQIDGSYKVVAQNPANSSGRTYLKWKGSTQGQHTFMATVGPCFILFNCGFSNKITVSVTDAPCDTWDIGCRIMPQLDTKLIMAAVAIVIIFLILLMYGPKKR